MIRLSEKILLGWYLLSLNQSTEKFTSAKITYASFGHIMDGDKILDQLLVSISESAFLYWRKCSEISCHGSVIFGKKSFSCS